MKAAVRSLSERICLREDYGISKRLIYKSDCFSGSAAAPPPSRSSRRMVAVIYCAGGVSSKTSLGLEILFTTGKGFNIGPRNH